MIESRTTVINLSRLQYLDYMFENMYTRHTLVLLSMFKNKNFTTSKIHVTDKGMCFKHSRSNLAYVKINNLSKTV